MSIEGKRVSRLRNLSLGASAVAVLVCSMAAPAYAQDDVQNQSVLERDRPQYENDGIRAGSFIIRPQLDTSVDFNDNIFADETDTESDVRLLVRPQVLVRLNQPIVDLQLRTGFDLERFADNSSEDTDGYFAGLRGTIGRGQATQVRFQLDYRSDNESRRALDSASGLATRLGRDSFEGRVELRQDLGDINAFLSGRARRITFGSARDSDGELVDFSFRDQTLYRVTGGAEYSVSANDLIIARASYDKREQDVQLGDPELDIAGFDRSSDGFRAELGYGRQVSELLYLRVFVGYLEQDFDDPRVRDISGISVNSDVFWNVTPLTSVRVAASRSIDEVVSPDRAGNLRTQVSAQVDHELRRNFILSARARFADISPRGLGDTNDEFEASLTGQLFVNRLITLNGGFSHFQRNSSRVGGSFDENVFSVGVRLRL